MVLIIDSVPLLQPHTSLRDYKSRNYKSDARGHPSPVERSRSPITKVAAASKTGEPAPAKHRPTSAEVIVSTNASTSKGVGQMVELPSDGNALVGTQFLVRGSWWKGATSMERQSLYPAKCVAFDEDHPFVSYKRKPDLTRVRIEKTARAIKFVLTRTRDKTWNTGDLWMTLTQYTEYCRKYDPSLLQSDSDKAMPPKKKPRLDAPLLPLRESVQALAPAQPSAAAAAAVVSAAASVPAVSKAILQARQRYKVLAMPDNYQRCKRYVRCCSVC